MIRRHWPLLPILLLAAILRIINLGSASLWIDETFSLQSSAGRGYFVDLIPRGEILDPAPRPISLEGPPAPGPIWNIYPTQATDTNPPLYYVVLRLWREISPQTPAGYRFPSVIVSLLIVAAMYAGITTAFSRRAGIVAALIATLSAIQIEYAQEVRSYAMGTAFAALAMAALFRIEVHGFTRKRAVFMGACAFAAISSLYLAALPIVAIGIYAATTLRAPTRNRLLLTGLLTAIATAAFLGPLLRWQLPWLSYRNAWLLSPDPRTLLSVVEDTARALYGQLAPLAPNSLYAAYATCVLVLLLAIPLWIHVPRSRLFLIWTVLSIGVLSYWDLSASKLHLQLNRYTLTAGPGVIGIIVSLGALASRPAFRLLAAVPYAALLLTVISAPMIYRHTKPAIRELTAYAGSGHLLPTDLVVVGTNSQRDWENVLYLSLDAYIPHPFAAVVINKPLPDVSFIRREAERRGGLVLFIEAGAPVDDAIPPGWERTAVKNFPSIGFISTFRPPRAATAPTSRPDTP